MDKLAGHEKIASRSAIACTSISTQIRTTFAGSGYVLWLSVASLKPLQALRLGCRASPPRVSTPRPLGPAVNQQSPRPPHSSSDTARSP